jgi:hypothetical protein
MAKMPTEKAKVPTETDISDMINKRDGLGLLRALAGSDKATNVRASLLVNLSCPSCIIGLMIADEDDDDREVWGGVEQTTQGRFTCNLCTHTCNFGVEYVVQCLVQYEQPASISFIDASQEASRLALGLLAIREWPEDLERVMSVCDDPNQSTAARWEAYALLAETKTREAKSYLLDVMANGDWREAEQAATAITEFGDSILPELQELTTMGGNVAYHAEQAIENIRRWG